MGNLPSTLTSLPPLPALARVDSFSPSTFDPDSELDVLVQAGDADIDAESDDDSLASTTSSPRSSTEIIHQCGSTTDPITITTTSLPDSSASTSSFSESYDSFPDPELFPSSAPEPGSSVIWSAPEQHTGNKGVSRTRKRATSSASSASICSASSRVSITDRIGERLSQSLPKVNLHRTPRVDGRRWVVGSPPSGLGERKAIRVGYPFYEEVAVKAELERGRSVRGRMRKGLELVD